MSVSDRHNTYTEADIQRYLEGKMTPAEMHRFEVTALDDPFLHDALEGYSIARSTEDPDKINAIVKELEKFKPGRGAKKYNNVIIPLWQRNIMQYAVAAMLVGVAGWYIFKAPGNRQGVTTAKEELPALIPADSSVASVPVNPPAKNTTSLPSNQDLAVSKVKNEPFPSPRQSNKNKGIPEPVKTPLQENPQQEFDKDENPLPETKPEPATTRAATAQIPAPPVAVASEKVAPAPAQPSPILRGKVTDMENFPLDNISIQVKGSKSGTVTDELGRFALKIPDSTATIVASGPGFKTKEIAGVPQQEPVDLKMERSAMSLDEVVVSGYGKKRKSPDWEIDTTEAVPSGGWKNFTDYLQQNKGLNKSGKNNQVVIIAFEIDSKGRPTEFDILQSAGKKLDNEAIRLLEAGPAWINKTKNPPPLLLKSPWFFSISPSLF